MRTKRAGLVPGTSLAGLWRQEFRGYGGGTFAQDLRAGLTVAAVALPLALAFGVASGSTAAAGLVTAIVGGALIGALGGAPYQVSGPTGAMSAVLIVIALDHGPRGLWVAGAMAGLLILVLGLFRLGRFIAFVPAPVITGFTSGIAAVIFIGQIDNALGIRTAAQTSSTRKLLGYLLDRPPAPSWQAIACAAGVAAVMLLAGRSPLGRSLPAPLLGIALVTAVAALADWDVTTIGAIPRTVIPSARFVPAASDLGLIPSLIGPVIAIAALGAIESLLAGSVAGRMTGQKLAADQELVAQGIGNVVLPFVGGVPATAAIARMTVGVKAGGATRVVSFVQSGALLLGALFFGSLIGAIPLAGLAGVLMVTAFRMNEWHIIRHYAGRRLLAPVGVMIATMAATVTFDLTKAIAIGMGLELALVLVAALRSRYPLLRLFQTSVEAKVDATDRFIVEVEGPLWFCTAERLARALDALEDAPAIVLDLARVPFADASGFWAVEHARSARRHGQSFALCGLTPQVETLFARSGLIAALGHDGVFPNRSAALAASERSPVHPVEVLVLAAD